MHLGDFVKDENGKIFQVQQKKSSVFQNGYTYILQSVNSKDKLNLSYKKIKKYTKINSKGAIDFCIDDTLSAFDEYFQVVNILIDKRKIKLYTLVNSLKVRFIVDQKHISLFEQVMVW